MPAQKKITKSRRSIIIAVVVLCILVYLMISYFSPKSSMAPTLPLNPSFRNAELEVEKRITDLLSYMTLEEKIGQMTLVEKNSIENIEDVSTYGLGQP